MRATRRWTAFSQNWVSVHPVANTSIGLDRVPAVTVVAGTTTGSDTCVGSVQERILILLFLHGTGDPLCRPFVRDWSSADLRLASRRNSVDADTVTT